MHKEKNHMGERLRLLADWYGGTYASFTKKFGRSVRWFNYNIEEQRIDRKNILNICSKLGIPESYFEGKTELPAKNQMNEPQAEYISAYARLENENKRLKETILERDRELIEVMRKYQECLEEKQRMLHH